MKFKQYWFLRGCNLPAYLVVGQERIMTRILGDSPDALFKGKLQGPHPCFSETVSLELGAGRAARFSWQRLWSPSWEHVQGSLSLPSSPGIWATPTSPLDSGPFQGEPSSWFHLWFALGILGINCFTIKLTLIFLNNAISY